MTGYYVVINIVVQTIVALGLALLMDRVTKSTFSKGIILLPYLIATVVVALLWFWMLDAQLGIVNQFLEFIGLSGQSWFGNPNLVIPTIAMVNVWKYMGYTALLIYAGLQTIPPSRCTRRRRWTGQPASRRSGGSRCPCSGRCWCWC